jgi:hypothetical protein
MALLFPERKKSPQRSLDDIVGEYFDTNDRDVVALADSLNMRIPALYFALNSESNKANLRGFAPQEDRLLIVDEIHRRAFGKNRVFLDIPTYATKLPFESLADAVAYVQMMMGPNTFLVTRPYDVGMREVMVSIVDVRGEPVLGIVSGLTTYQYNKLLEEYKVR